MDRSISRGVEPCNRAKRGLLIGLSLALFLSTGGCAREAASRPLNVVVIMLDALRADHLSAYGYERKTSPEIDRVARKATLFERNWSQAPCTFPSVNSLLTSRFPVHLLETQDSFDLGIVAGVPTLAEMLRARGYDTYAISASPIVRQTPSRFNHAGGFGRGFETFDEECLWRDASCMTRQAVPIIRSHAGAEAKRPFFLYLHYMDTHGPYRPPATFSSRFAGPYRGDKAWVANGDPNPIAAMLYRSGPAVEYTQEDIEYLKARYDDEIAFADSEIGALLTEIESLGLTDRTLLVIVADHGESFMENGQMKHCYHLYDHNVRTPLIIRLPGATVGRRVATATSNLDVVPTVLALVDEALGREVGADARAMSRGIQGSSLRPLLERNPAEPAGDAFAFASIGSLRMVTDRRFKLIKDLRSGELQLFDLVEDPGESANVATQKRPLVRLLERQLDAWVRAEEGSDTAMERTEATQRNLRALGYLQ